ncbi:MAG: ABC transporter ATP-binding protein [Oscillospiraceae bacterium]
MNKNKITIKEKWLALKELVNVSSIFFLFIVGLLSIAIAVVAPLISYMYKYLIDYITISQAVWKIIGKTIIGYIFLEILLEILENIQGHVITILNLKVEEYLPKRINEQLSRIEIDTYESSHNYDLIDRVVINICDGIKSMLNTTLSIVSPAFQVITFAWALGNVVWYFPIIIILGNLPYSINLFMQNKKNYQQAVILSRHRRVIKYFQSVLTGREFAKDIRINKSLSFFEGKYLEEKEKVFSDEKRLFIEITKSNLFSQCSRMLALGICLAICVVKIEANVITLGSFVMVYSIMNSLLSNFNSLLGQIAGADSFTNYLCDWIALKKLPCEPEKDSQSFSSFEKIDFVNVSYKYRNSEENTIKQLNLSIKKGERILIVGRNGSGKSTLLYLLLGIYTATSGQILVNELPIKSVLMTYRNKISCFFQTFIRFQLSVAENVSCGKHNSTYNQDFTQYLKDHSISVETNLGQLEKNAKELSGGEWQRIGLERAFQKQNTEVLIFDEPSSNLDVQEQQFLLNRLQSIPDEKTVIVVSHHLNLAEYCTRVIFLENGKILEDGSHTELLKQRGEYFNFYNRQKKATI